MSILCAAERFYSFGFSSFFSRSYNRNLQQLFPCSITAAGWPMQRWMSKHLRTKTFFFFNHNNPKPECRDVNLLLPYGWHYTSKTSYSFYLFISLTVKYGLMLFTVKDENPGEKSSGGSAKGNGCSWQLLAGEGPVGWVSNEDGPNFLP